MNFFWRCVSKIRGVVTSAAAAAGDYLRVSLTGKAGGEYDSVQHFQQYGLQSRLRAGAEVIALRQGNSIVIVAGDDTRYRLALVDGDTVLYSDTDNYIKMKGAGGIEVNVNGEYLVKADSVKLGGEHALRKLIDERLIGLYNAHVHPAPGGTTSAPSVLLNANIVATTVTEAK